VVRLTIESLAYGGDSVARLDDGRIAFVRGGCPGDLVDATILADKGNFVTAEVTDVVEASPDRVIPPCPYFGVCGGCTWQHVAYSAQLDAKTRAVRDALERIGGTAASVVSDCMPSRREYGYRNKVELVPDPSSRRPLLGFHRAHSDEVVPVDACLLLPERARSAPKALKGALRYIAGESDLGIARVGIRVAAHRPDLEIALWTEPGAFPRRSAASTLGQAVKSSSIVRVLAKTAGKQRSISGVEVLSGRGHWREALAGRTMTVSAPSFFQVNSDGAEDLVRLVRDAIRADGSDRVCDLYAGAGTFTLPLAEDAGEVVAVEAASSAVRDLRRNLENAGLWAEVVGGDAARELPELGRFDAVLVDPPRTGLHRDIIGALAAVRPGKIVYVSCDPATLARDVRLLGEAGFALTQATPVDLFPQTYHVETVAVLEPTKA